MKRTICIFEDEGYKNFLPLTYLRPVYDLRCGIYSIREKIHNYFTGSLVTLHTRKYLEDLVKLENPKLFVNNLQEENTLFVNGRLIMDTASAKEIKNLEINSVLTSEDGSIVAANIDAENIIKLNTIDNDFYSFEFFKRKESAIKLINYPWELVNLNGQEIINDFSNVIKKNKSVSFKKYSSAEFRNKKQIFISKDVVIDPFVFLDASEGPIYIGKNARIMSNSLIQGPAFIGEGSTIKAHASVYHNTSIGEICKVGGEIESTIIQSYSNKQHEGFLGHSYLGSWINIGASTNNSDLKNNYENISVMLNGKPIDTHSQFVGLIMGDHSKTAINTMFNTGTIIGISCNIFGAGFPARNIPSFSWGGSDFLKTYDIKKSITAAEKVMIRRGKKISETEVFLLQTIFDLTSSERNRKNVVGTNAN